MRNHVFVCGYPSDIGGANTELWHTVKLWRRFGLGVTLIPTWNADPVWQARLAAIGCNTLNVEPSAVKLEPCSLSLEPSALPGLPGSVVVSMCNTRFLSVADGFRRLGCKIVWLGCMNWLFPAERLHYCRHGCFDRHVFQSRYQHDQLVPQLRRFGYRDEQGAVIRGAFDVEDFPLRPLEHSPGEIFTIGRVSRAAADKFAPQTWQIYARVPHPIRARVLGWSAEVRARVGPPPPWATCLAPGGQSPQEFLATLGAMVHAGGQATENWPRVGLEAMAAGVPVVADNRGGWREMIRHGETGYLCQGEEDFAYYTARLARDEPHRQEIIRQARQSLETQLAEPGAIWASWRQLLSGLDTE